MLELLPNVGKAAVARKPRKRVKKTLQCPSDTSRPCGSSCWQQTRHTLGVQRVLWGRHRGLGVVGTTPESSWQGRSPASWHSAAQHVVAFSSARELLFGSQPVQNGQTGQCSALSRTRTELPGGGSARHPWEMQPEGANKKIRTYHSTSKYTVFLQSTLPIRV